jgi:hypothetical protein
VLLLFFVLSNVNMALTQNYMISEIGEVEDGMAIVNLLTAWIIIMIEKGLTIKG